MKKYIFMVFLIIIAVIVIAGFREVVEEGVITFAVSGRIFDEKDKLPLYSAELILTLDPGDLDHPDILQEAFRKMTSRWDGIPQRDWIGKSTKEGTFVTEGQRPYTRKYTSWYGIWPKLARPYEKAWIVIRKKGYAMKTIEVSTTGWKTGDADRKITETIPDVFLARK